MAHQYQRRDFVLKRGDTWVLRNADDSPLVFTNGLNLMAGGVLVWSTIKRFNTDRDPGLSQVNSASVGGIQILDEHNLIVTHPKLRTARAPLANLWYDIAVDFAPTKSRVYVWGRILCTADVSRAA